MASFGKLHGIKNNPRTNSLLVIAKANNLNIEFVEQPSGPERTEEYRRLNKLALIPTFEGADGYVLTEVIAIAVYLASQNEKTTLLGKTKQDYASILQWLSFSNAHIVPTIGACFRPLTGQDPYNKKHVEEANKNLAGLIKILSDHLLVNTYLVGDRLTLADIFVASTLTRGYQYLFGKQWREQQHTVSRWYETVHNQPIYTDALGPVTYIDTPLENKPPKKEEKPKEQPKKAEPKKKEAEEEEEEEDKPAPKPKHPLEALPKATFVLDDWKRKYSNEETREVALPWFWENCKFDEYSLWQVDYKYNEELTMTFMTSNLIGGFFARLEGSRKYIFGACSVYGVTNDSVVKGAFLIRGQDATPAFDVAPDMESYSFKKLDPTNAADKEYVNEMWAWDKPVQVNGKTYEWADGKVFK